MKYDFDKPVDYAIALVNKKTGDKEGRVLAYGVNAGTCHACVQLYIGNVFDGKSHIGRGSASGGGYDKLSSAIADALHDTGIATKSATDPALASSAAGFTGHKYNDNEVAAICECEKIIPVYAGTGNQQYAFGIFFKVLEVVG
jgi:hypothetical protein